MIDAKTKTPVRVLVEGDAPPFIEVEFGHELDEVRRILDFHNIPYRVEDDIISFNGGPEIATIDLGRKADAAVIQMILDAAL